MWSGNILKDTICTIRDRCFVSLQCYFSEESQNLINQCVCRVYGSQLKFYTLKKKSFGFSMQMVAYSKLQIQKSRTFEIMQLGGLKILFYLTSKQLIHKKSYVSQKQIKQINVQAPSWFGRGGSGELPRSLLFCIFPLHPPKYLKELYDLSEYSLKITESA